MTASKIRHLYPTQQLPSLLAKSGRSASEGVPLRWLEAMVQECLGAIGTNEQERNSAVVYGTEHLRVTFEDQLTAEEQLRDRLEATEAKLRAAIGSIQALRGGPMTADEVKLLLQSLEG